MGDDQVDEGDGGPDRQVERTVGDDEGLAERDDAERRRLAQQDHQEGQRQELRLGEGREDADRGQAPQGRRKGSEDTFQSPASLRRNRLTASTSIDPFTTNW